MEYPHSEYAFQVGDEIIIFSEGPDVFFETFNRVPRAIGLIHATFWCDVEVSNGGFRQLLWNSAGILAPEAVEGFVAIGQPRVADLVREAIASLGLPYPRNREARIAAVDMLPKRFFYVLDDRFYALKDAEGGGFRMACERYAIANGFSPEDPPSR